MSELIARGEPCGSQRCHSASENSLLLCLTTLQASDLHPRPQPAVGRQVSGHGFCRQLLYHQRMGSRNERRSQALQHPGFPSRECGNLWKVAMAREHRCSCSQGASASARRRFQAGAKPRFDCCRRCLDFQGQTSRNWPGPGQTRAWPIDLGAQIQFGLRTLFIGTRCTAVGGRALVRALMVVGPTGRVPVAGRCDVRGRRGAVTVAGGHV